MDTLRVTKVFGAKSKPTDKIDVKSGEIFLMQDKGGIKIKHKMYMKVFRNEYEHHAQIYTDAGFMYLNDVMSLRNCDVTVDKQLNRITITSENIAIRSVAAYKRVLLEANSQAETLEWEQSLTPSDGLQPCSEFSPQVSPMTSKRSLDV